MHRHVRRQARAELDVHLVPVGGPTARADERRRDQDDRRQVPLGMLLGQRVDEDRAADGMADHDRAVAQPGDLVPDGRAPRRGGRIVLVGQAGKRISHPSPNLAPEAGDELVVPLVVDARAAALDEEDLPGVGHRSSLWGTGLLLAFAST